VLPSSAHVSAEERDPNPANNSADVTTTVNPALVWFGRRSLSVLARDGRFVAGASVTYTLSLTNNGAADQLDNPGPEFQDVLPPGLLLVSAGTTAGTLVADIPANTVTWNGSLPSQESVTITIEATIRASVGISTIISSQGRVFYDADANGTNEALALTDDSRAPGSSDPTTFVVVSPPLNFSPLTPCRLVDSRETVGPFGGPPLQAGGHRVLSAFGRCGIPRTAQALSVNLTVTQSSAAGDLRIHPAGTPLAGSSTINYLAGQTRANSAVIVLNDKAEVTVFCAQASGVVHLILDVNGYFE
jgi:uncharacterized repeat protein (TIGR01451 family)